MPYEVFTRKVTRTGSPTLSFSKNGQIQFNQRAAGILQQAAVEHILLLWDPIASRFAIKTTSNKKDNRAYRIRFAASGNGAAFSAKTFMDFLELDYSERRTFTVEINPDSEILIEVEIPQNYFSKKAQPRLLKQGKVG